MRTHTNQSGYSVVELVVVLAVVGVLGLVGYVVYNRQQTKSPLNTTQAESSQATAAGHVASAPNINSTSDLNKATAILNQTDPGGSDNSDSSQLDSQTANF